MGARLSQGSYFAGPHVPAFLVLRRAFRSGPLSTPSSVSHQPNTKLTYEHPPSLTTLGSHPSGRCGRAWFDCTQRRLEFFRLGRAKEGADVQRRSGGDLTGTAT